MNELRKTEDNLSRSLFGISKDEALASGICIDCKGPPKFYSDAGKKEYRISGMCEYCFDKCCGED